LFHEGEEIEQPSLGERLADGGRAFPFAERLVGYVRVGYVVMPFGRLGILGHDVVTGTFADLFPVQHDAEGAQVSSSMGDVRTLSFFS
jgi:hypothetical protein